MGETHFFKKNLSENDKSNEYISFKRIKLKPYFILYVLFKKKFYKTIKFKFKINYRFFIFIFLNKN